MELLLEAFDQERTKLEFGNVSISDCIQGQIVLHTKAGVIYLPGMRGQWVYQENVQWFIGFVADRMAEDTPSC